MKYYNPENERVQYVVRETLNGFAIQVLNADRDERYPLTPAIAYKIGLTLPEDFRCDASDETEVVAQLERLAKANGLIEIE